MNLNPAEAFHVVYKINRYNCNNTYIGKTTQIHEGFTYLLKIYERAASQHNCFFRLAKQTGTQSNSCKIYKNRNP